MSDDKTYAEIANALQPYFDGLYEGDVAKMKQIFHPQCMLTSAPGGREEFFALDDYYARVADRPSPKSQGQARYDAILSIQARSEGAAIAVLRTARAPRLYTDFLSLLRIDGRWQIVNKTYSWTDLVDAVE